MYRKKIARLHDKIYLKENRYKKPLEKFILLVKLLKKYTDKRSKYSLLDVGCANGELLYNLDKYFKNVNLTGIDIRKDLIIKAKKKLPGYIKLFKKNIYKKNLIINNKSKKNKKYDIIILSGTIGIFDFPEIVFKNLLLNLNNKGQIFIMDNFNIYPFNVFIKYEDLKLKNVLQPGFNTFSINHVKKYFRNKKIQFIPFQISKKIKKNKSDLMRAWTLNINKKRYFTNALGIIMRQYWVRIF